MLLGLSVLVVGALGWVAPDDCPGREALERRHRQLVGRDAELPAGQVLIERTAEGHRVTLTLERPGSLVRTLESANCAELVQAAALILSLESQVTPVLPPPEVVAMPEAPKVRGWLGVMGGPRFGLIRSVSIRARVEGAVEWRRVRARVGFTTGSGGPLLGVPQPTSGVALAVPFSGDLSACVIAVPGPVSLAACAGGELGVISGTGVGLREVSTGSAPWLALTGGLQVTIALTAAVGLRLEGFAGANVVRPRMVLADGAQLFQVPVWTGGGSLGVEVRLW